MLPQHCPSLRSAGVASTSHSAASQAGRLPRAQLQAARASGSATEPLLLRVARGEGEALSTP